MADPLPPPDDRIRCCTVVKVQHTDSSLDLSSFKSRTEKLCSKEESLSTQWTTCAPTPPPLPDDTLLDSLTPIISTPSTLTKPKRIHSINENIFCGKPFNSSTFVVSERHFELFEDKSKRSDTFDKKLKEFKNKDKYRESELLNNSRKSRLIFVSQIYLLFHISITICLIGYKEYETNFDYLISHRILITIYFTYLLFVSIVLILLLRCLHIYSDHIGLKVIRSEQISILVGAASLGLINLAHLALEIVECLHTELVFIPVLHFAFTLFFIHFMLTQVIQDKHLGLRNVVISHLLSTQISLWLISFDDRPDVCYFSYEENDNNLNEVNTRHPLLPSNVLFLMNPIIHNYKLLTIFILITIWFTNNQSNISFIRAKLFDEDTTKSTFLSGKQSLKGFAIGFVIFLTSILVIVLDEKPLLRITHILIQIISTIVSIIGLIIIQKNKKYLNYKYKNNFLDFHFVVYLTLLGAYVYGMSQMMVKSGSKEEQMVDILHGLTLIMQISIQSFVIRLQRRKFVHINHIYIVCLFSNLSLWIIEIYFISDQMHTNDTILNTAFILPLFVSLNRFYSCLVFYQFWKTN